MELGATFQEGAVGGDVRNRLSVPPPKKFLISSLTTEKCFLFGRNKFYRSLPGLLCFFDNFSSKIPLTWYFGVNSTSNWVRTSNRYSDCAFRSLEQD